MHLQNPIAGTNDVMGSGENQYGAIGNNSTTDRTTPAPWNAGTTLTSHGSLTGAGGWVGSVYIRRTTDNTLLRWGYNGYGQLGLGNTTDQIVPNGTFGSGVLEIFPLSQNFFRNAALNTSPLIRRSDGYYMAGYNVNAQLGAGIAASQSTTFVKVRFPARTTIKLLGYAHHINEGLQYIAVDTDNYFWTWGYNGSHGIDEYDTDAFFQPIRFNPLAFNR
jgi:hypothetical protein